jgi:hypothetical protein
MPNDDRSETAHEAWSRLLPAIATFVLPILAGFLMIAAVHWLFPDGEWPAIKSDYFISATYDRLAHDLEGRLLYGTLSGFGRVVAVAAVAFALIVLLRTFEGSIGVAFWAVAAIGGAMYGCFDARYSTLRPKILDDGLEAAQSAHLIAQDTLLQVHSTILINTVLGFCGTTTLLAAFAAIAWRSDPAKVAEFAEERLRQRLSDLQVLALLGAAILVFLVLANKVQLGWVESLMNPDPAKSFRVLASAAANFWGATGTAALICVLLPAYAGLRSDIDMAARQGRENNYPAQLKWKKDNALEFAPTAVIGAALTAAAPLLSGPALDIANALLR